MPERPGQATGQACGEHPGVDGTGHRRVDGHHRFHRGAPHLLDVGDAQGPARLLHQDHARWRDRHRGGALQREVATAGDEQRPGRRAGEHRGHGRRGDASGGRVGGVEATAVDHDRAAVGGEEPGQHLTPGRRPQGSVAPGQEGDARSGVELEAGEGAGGHVAPGPGPTGEAGAGGIGPAEHGGHVAGEVDEQGTGARGAGQQTGEGPRHQGGASSAFCGPTGDEHEILPRATRQRRGKTKVTVDPARPENKGHLVVRLVIGGVGTASQERGSHLRTQDEGAAIAAARTRTPRAAFLAGVDPRLSCQTYH